MRREKDGLFSLPRLGDRRAKCRLHQWVKARRRLIEDEDLGTRGKGRDQLNLLTVALGKGAHLLRRVEVEASNESVSIRAIATTSQIGQIFERFRTRQRWPERRFGSNICRLAVRGNRIRPGVMAGDQGSPLG